MLNLMEAGEAVISVSVVLWVLLIVHIVLTFAFLIAHYFSCFCDSRMCCGYEGDKKDVFFLIRRFNPELYDFEEGERNIDTATDYYETSANVVKEHILFNAQ